LGKVSHQDFFSYDNHGCLCDELTNNEDDCCKDEVEVVVIDEDQRTFDQLVSIVPKLNILFEFEFNVLEELGLYQRLEAVYYDYPPPKQQPLYSLNSNYTFYG
jgi:hypothetical protein